MEDTSATKWKRNLHFVSIIEWFLYQISLSVYPPSPSPWTINRQTKKKEHLGNWRSYSCQHTMSGGGEKKLLTFGLSFFLSLSLSLTRTHIHNFQKRREKKIRIAELLFLIPYFFLPFSRSKDTKKIEKRLEIRICSTISHTSSHEFFLDLCATMLDSKRVAIKKYFIILWMKNIY